MLKFEIQGHDSSGTPSTHAASAGGHIPTHHDHHPEPHNEDLGVCHIYNLRFEASIGER